jgi:hypothetical protein
LRIVIDERRPFTPAVVKPTIRLVTRGALLNKLRCQLGTPKELDV